MTRSIIPKNHTLLFDLDGTISDPFVGISASINHALHSRHFATVADERIKPLIGPPLHDIFLELTGLTDGDELNQLVNAYRERYADIGYTENTLYAGMSELLAALAERGYAMGVCTSKRADYAAAILEMFKLNGYFRFLSGGGDGVHKADQIAALIEDGLDPGKAVMIGDRRFDIEAAKLHLIATIGVSWGFAADDELVNGRRRHNR